MSHFDQRAPVWSRFVRSSGSRGVVSCIVLSILTPAVARAVTVISDVPAYKWYHGCGPTAAGAIFGYWDLHGYSNLFDAEGDDLYLTANVQDQISSPEHNAKYDPTPDADLPEPVWTSIADWFQTSVGGLDYGWSYLGYADDAFEGYADYRGYDFDSWYESLASGAFTWEDLVAEIDAGRPMMFLVDSSGSGSTDHFVPVVGYDDRGEDGLWYGLYTTWVEFENVVWKQFRPMSSDYTWGVSYGIFVQPIPEPGTAVIVGAGAVILLRRRRD